MQVIVLINHDLQRDDSYDSYQPIQRKTEFRTKLPNIPSIICHVVQAGFTSRVVLLPCDDAVWRKSGAILHRYGEDYEESVL